MMQRLATVLDDRPVRRWSSLKSMYYPCRCSDYFSYVRKFRAFFSAKFRDKLGIKFRHIRTQHGQHTTPLPCERSKCHLCIRSFGAPKGLYEHLRNIHKVRVYSNQKGAQCAVWHPPTCTDTLGHDTKPSPSPCPAKGRSAICALCLSVRRVPYAFTSGSSTR